MPYILQRVGSSVSSIKSHMCKEKKISSLLFFTESEGRNGPQILDSRISVAPVMLPSAGQPIQNIPRPAFFVPATGVAARCGSVLPVHFHRSQQFRERRGRVGFPCSQDRILGKHVGRITTRNLPSPGYRKTHRWGAGTSLTSQKLTVQSEGKSTSLVPGHTEVRRQIAIRRIAVNGRLLPIDCSDPQSRATRSRNAPRSSLPFTVRGRASTFTKARGRMAPAMPSRHNCASAASSMSPR